MLNPPEIHLCNQRLPPNAIRDHEMRARAELWSREAAGFACLFTGIHELTRYSCFVVVKAA